jgi:diaminopimelate epimerase
MRLSFTKMHGLGNDFVVLDAFQHTLALTSEQVRFLADRHRGVGCDQVLMVEPPNDASADFFYRIYNSDGTEAQQCGNGARCFARFVHSRGLTVKEQLELQTRSGRIRVILGEGDEVHVNMGVPRFEPADLPFRAARRAPSYRRRVGATTIEFGAVSVGNPHAVVRVANVDEVPVERIGPALESHGDFPQRVNVGFMQVLGPEHVRLRVYERGAGETLACGSGACAAVAVGHVQQLLGKRATVDLLGGRLVISWQGEGTPLWMRGPATHVFEGTVEI